MSMPLKKKIMIVDDERSWVSIMTMRLENEGYDVVSAFDPVTAKQKIRSVMPNLIILDIVMPAGGGLALLENIRVNTKTLDIPVIVISGLSDMDIRRKAESFGISAFFSKIFDYQDLREQVEKIMS